LIDMSIEFSMVHTVKNTSQRSFQDEVNEMSAQGYKLLSCSCNTYQHSDYPEETYWTAILFKEGAPK